MKFIKKLNLYLFRIIIFSSVGLGLPIMSLMDITSKEVNSLLEGFGVIFFVWAPIVIGCLILNGLLLVNSKRILERFYTKN